VLPSFDEGLRFFYSGNARGGGSTAASACISEQCYWLAKDTDGQTRLKRRPVCMGFRALEKFSPAMPVGSWDCSAGGYRTRYGKA
jgi:hypothetical protein